MSSVAGLPASHCAGFGGELGRRSDGAKADAGRFDRLAVASKLHPRAGADDGDVHLVPRNEPLVGRAALGGGGGKTSVTSNSPGCSTFLPGRRAELLDLHLALPLGTGDDARRAVGDQRGNRIGRGRRVAQVAADAGPALNLPAADDPRRIGQRGIGLRDLGVFVDPVARHARPQPQALAPASSSAPSARGSS